MGVRYISAIVKTPYKWSASRKKVAKIDMNRLTPTEKRRQYRIGNGKNTIDGRSGVPVKNKIRDSAPREHPRFTNEDSVRESGRIYFGIYAFFRIPAPAINELIDSVVAS